ncbi:hypothetical protein [[Curtobacterium] plantarum]|uniref:Uncharacterized protein n=1 Tax=[Curtobacterium] plantarum TaxID=221276 RepID=A0ABT9T9H8_9GAMM|nr:hypothetical protein [[Curtobacterium] plantarum]MDQ0019053.1 hypothetical protein [[Curtobacterium] plantarum]
MSDKKYPSNLYLESVTTNVDFASHVSVEAVIVMARELLALRKAFSETAVYEAEINGVMSSVTKSHYEDCKKYGVKTRQLIVKPSLL